MLLRSLFTLQQRYQTIANPPPGVVEGQVVCEEGGGEGGLKGHVLQRATGLGMLTVVKVNEPHCCFCFKVQGTHPSCAHVTLCPEAEGLAQMQPCHFNQVYN